MKVFRVSHVNENYLCLNPRIPVNLSEGEDCITARICCSMSLNGCLSSIDNLDYHDILYVYSAEVDKFYQPNETQVYDVYLTGELWLFEKVIFHKIGILEITGYIGQDYKGRVNNQYAFLFKSL